MSDKNTHTAEFVRFTERAPEIRHDRTLITAMAGYGLCAFIVICMLLKPELYGTAFGDGVFAVAEQWFMAILIGTIAVGAAFFHSLLAPFHGTAEVQFDRQADEVRILHDGICTATVKLSQIQGVITGPCPLVAQYREGLIEGTPRWFVPAWFFPFAGVDGCMRRRAVTEFVYLVTGDGAAHRHIEVAAFMADGTHGVQDAAQAAQAIERALRAAHQ